MNDFHLIFQELDNRLVQIAADSATSGGRLIKRSILRILGQVSLLVQPEVSAKLRPFATTDVDGLIEGEVGLCRAQLKEVLSKYGLEFDDLSTEIWLPRTATYKQIFSGQKLTVEALDPVSALVSKAVKAPEKNRILIANGMMVYGEELIQELDFYKVDKNQFVKRHGHKL